MAETSSPECSSPESSSPDADIPEFPSILNVLLIDSDLEALEFIKKTCEQNSYKVIACSESLNAVHILLERKTIIHFILMEVHMPRMHGYEFLRFVEKKGINIPVIMMSQDDNKASVMHALELGACAYFEKPLDEHTLKNMWIQVYRTEIENRTKKK